MNKFTELLSGGDLRSLSKSSEVVKAVHDQSDFDTLFRLLFHHQRIIVMRAADAVEKITKRNREFLNSHKNELLNLLKAALNKELKWHLALLVTRLELSNTELIRVWRMLTYWALNPYESKIVRVNSLQGLFELSNRMSVLKPNLERTIRTLEREHIPSISARLRKLNVRGVRL